MRARAMAVLLVAACASPILPMTARALMAAWKDVGSQHGGRRGGHRERLRSGMSWAGAIEGRPVYCPPSAYASFRDGLWAALVVRTSLGVPQDCWFDAASSGAQVLKARAAGLPAQARASWGGAAFTGPYLGQIRVLAASSGVLQP